MSILRLQGQVRLAFPRPNFRNLASFRLKLIGLQMYLAFFWPFSELFGFLLKFSSGKWQPWGKLPYFRVNCFAVSLHCVTITWQQIF